MDIRTKQRIFSESVNANRGTLIKYIQTLVDRQDGMTNGSGTIFKIGDHLLIATARHVIPNNPTGRIWPLTREVRHDRGGFPGYVSLGRHPEYDVGYLEVHPEGAENYFGHREYCTVDQIALRGFGRRDKSVIVVGAPAAHAQVTRHNENTLTYKANVMTYWTIPLLPNEWPSLPADAPPADEGVDIFLSYPEDDTITADGFAPINLPHPGGMSGGGVWDQEFNQGELWDPTAIKLIGIQSCWDDEAQYLRASVCQESF